MVGYGINQGWIEGPIGGEECTNVHSKIALEVNDYGLNCA